jgi:hypothetical protein
MHLAIGLITYNLLVRLAPVRSRPAERPAVRVVAQPQRRP